MKLRRRAHFTGLATPWRLVCAPGAVVLLSTADHLARGDFHATRYLAAHPGFRRPPLHRVDARETRTPPPARPPAPPSGGVGRPPRSLGHAHPLRRRQRFQRERPQ